MFVKNCLAAAGADLTLKVEPSNVTYIFDNEPRNKEICKQIEKIISQDRKIVIWPDNVKEKDINDMFLADIPVGDIIKNNTFEGAEAQLRFAKWRKINA